MHPFEHIRHRAHHCLIFGILVDTDGGRRVNNNNNDNNFIFLLSSRNTVCFSSLNAWCFKYQIKMLTLLQVKVQVQVLSALTLLIIIKCILENQPDGKSRMIVLFCCDSPI